jgi:hypothetical protein
MPMRSLKTLLLTLALAGATTSVRAVTFTSTWLPGMYTLGNQAHYDNSVTPGSRGTAPTVGFTNIGGPVSGAYTNGGSIGGSYGVMGTLAGNGIVYYNLGNASYWASTDSSGLANASDKILRLTVYNDSDQAGSTSQNWTVGLWYTLAGTNSYPLIDGNSLLNEVTLTPGNPGTATSLTLNLSSALTSGVTGVGFYVENPLGTSGTFRISVSPANTPPVPESGSVALLVGGALVGCLGLRRRYVRG